MREYYVAYSKKCNNDVFSISDIEYSIIPNRLGTWAADPFIIETTSEEVYCFAEIWEMKYNKGAIGYCRLDGNNHKWHIAIRENFHMSYPHIFSDGKNYYMCPEMGKSGEIAIYVAERFPDKWKKLDVLYDGGKNYADTTFFTKDGVQYGFTYDVANNYSTIFTVVNRKINFVHPNTILSEDGCRPGGNILHIKDKYIRVGQLGKPNYGYGLVFKSFNLDVDGYREQTLKEYVPSDFRIANKLKQQLTGVHTYNFHKNYAVIDLQMEGWSWNMIVGKIQQKMKLKLFK